MTPRNALNKQAQKSRACCVRSGIESNKDVDRAIDMTNGDEDYAADDAEKYL